MSGKTTVIRPALTGPCHLEEMRELLQATVFRSAAVARDVQMRIIEHLNQCADCRARRRIHQRNRALVEMMKNLIRQYPILAVVFDVDGVVVDSEVDMIAATNAALVQFGGRPIKMDWFKKNELGSHRDFLRGRGIKEDDFAAFDRLLEDLLYQSKDYPERPGIREVFGYVRMRNLSIYLSSACNCVVTHRKMTLNDLAHYIHSTHAGERKAETFRLIATELAVSPKNLAFVTDMGRDMDEAVKAGVEYVFGITSGYSTRDQLNRHRFPVVDDHRELVVLLNQVLK